MLQSILRKDIRGASVQAPLDRGEGLLASRGVRTDRLHVPRRGEDRSGGTTGTNEGRGVPASARTVILGAQAGVGGTQTVVVVVDADARPPPERVARAGGHAARHARRGR